MGLPSTENRENILRTLLSKEKVQEGLDFKEIATMTEGYSGSDLKVGFLYRCKLSEEITISVLGIHMSQD